VLYRMATLPMTLSDPSAGDSSLSTADLAMSDGDWTERVTQ